ncbi:MAG: bifunctional phosphoglucose/phosphomannose isomerase [Candidatus Bathyarchaeota archaeon]|nr:bifunctional phosphoglucose/phosphomannose isomerase [Candidatus Bathyarchaeota archaeon]
MREQILDFGSQFRSYDIALKRKYSNIIICGMGGSGLPGRILKDIARIPIINSHGYSLPFHSTGSLVICISYSGNTKETLSCYDEARKSGMDIVAITSGGKLLDRCRRHKVKHVLIPSGQQPRMAVGHMFSSLVGLLKGMLDKKLITSVSKLRLDPGKLERRGKSLAKRIKGKVPVVYSSIPSLSYFWKISLNESGKSLAFSNEFPELCHNALEALQDKKGGFIFIFLKDDKSKSAEQERIVREMYKRKGREVISVDLEGKTAVERVFSSVLLSYWTTNHLARIKCVDPEPVKMIASLKRKMS